MIGGWGWNPLGEQRTIGCFWPPMSALLRQSGGYLTRPAYSVRQENLRGPGTADSRRARPILSARKTSAGPERGRRLSGIPKSPNPIGKVTDHDFPQCTSDFFMMATEQSTILRVFDVRFRRIGTSHAAFSMYKKAGRKKS